MSELDRIKQIMPEMDKVFHPCPQNGRIHVTIYLQTGETHEVASNVPIQVI